MEVGKACDFEEQRKRLEKSFWEPGTSYADEVVRKLPRNLPYLEYPSWNTLGAFTSMQTGCKRSTFHARQCSPLSQ